MKYVVIYNILCLSFLLSVSLYGSDINSSLQTSIDSLMFKDVIIEKIDLRLSGDTLTLKKFDENFIFVYMTPMMCGSCIEQVLFLMDNLNLESKTILLFDGFILRNISLFSVESFDSYVIHNSDINISGFYNPLIFRLDESLVIKSSFSYNKCSDKLFFDFLNQR